MSKTRKDSVRNTTTNTVLEVIKRADGNFDVFLNGTLHRGDIQERWLPEELCVRLGFCGGEYDAILLEVNEYGRSQVRF